MKKPIYCLGTVVMAALLTACATGPGSSPADQAPRLTQDGERRYWDSAQAFGPVPADMADRLARRCEQLNTPDFTWKPQGFHPAALDLTGKPFAKGGVLCKSEKKS